MSNTALPQFEKKDEDNSSSYDRSVSATVTTSQSPATQSVTPNFAEKSDISGQPPIVQPMRYNVPLHRPGGVITNSPMPHVPQVSSTPQIAHPHRAVIPHSAPSLASEPTITGSTNNMSTGASHHHVSNVLATGLFPQGSPQPPPGHGAGHTQVQQQFQRLKVEDALSYLDQVKFQFGNQPQVYNDFLDIMKEFKSQSIDTPGVIARVSNLFNGHPDLIVGFNTFLPPGYKIEVSANDQVSVTGPNMVPQTIQPGSGSTTIQIHTPGNKYITHTTQPLPPRSQNVDNPVGQPALPLAPVQPVFNSSPGQVTAQSSSSNSANVPHPSNGGVPVPINPVQSSSQQGHSNSNQPVEFNHAISYVNKIKNRFQGQTDIYKSFLEILHKYQKEQRTVKESSGAYKPSLSETEVYSQVARLFKNDEDLLREFGQFLPDAGGAAAAAAAAARAGSINTPGSLTTLKTEGSIETVQSVTKSSSVTQNPTASSKVQRNSNQAVKKTFQTPASQQVSVKNIRSCSLKDVSLVEASKHGSLKEFGFFDQVRRALGSQEVYENFLRCILLYNNEIVGRTELIQLVQPFLIKYTDIFNRFKEFLGYKDGHTSEPPTQHSLLQTQHQAIQQGKEKHEGMAMEIDYTTLKRLGSSYRALPQSYEQPRCSGRDALCKEVLNDTWVSFPSWSEDSQFVTSRKTPFEEHVYRCEDERFELDVVIETNRATILVLEAVQKKLNRMSDEEKNKFTLNNCLGGSSEVVHRKSIHRIYGDKAPDIIDGLKKNASIAVPVVLKRLKLKDEEWREAQHQFNKIWREQNEKYYLKSLDHQGINFKPNDIKFIRSKSLLNEIEAIFDERQEAMESDAANVPTGPHMTLTYEDKSIIDDTASLIIHHVKRQSGIHKDDKQKMKVFIYQTLPDLFFSPRGYQPSDDEDDDDNEDDKDYEVKTTTRKSYSKRQAQMTRSKSNLFKDMGGYKPGDNADDHYHLFMANNHFYLFFRLHQLLCKRLLLIMRQAEKLAKESEKQSKNKDKKPSVADLLHLKKEQDIKVEDYYPAFLELVRNLLDGNIESVQYEDQLRDMFTIHAYIGFTMDRLVQNIVRQLQHIVQDEQCIQLMEMFAAEERMGATGGPLISQGQRAAVENAYNRQAEHLLTDENCFKILICQKNSQLHLGIVLLDNDEEQQEGESNEPANIARWSQYVEYYAQDKHEITPDIKNGLSKKAVFLQRNARKLKSAPKIDAQEDHPVKGSTSRTDKIEIKFAMNSYKIKYVPGTEDILYREGSKNASKIASKIVSKQLHNKFQIWHTNWERENISRDMSRQANNWLMGKSDGLMSNVTTCSVEKYWGLARNMFTVQFQESKSKD